MGTLMVGGKTKLRPKGLGVIKYCWFGPRPLKLEGTRSWLGTLMDDKASNSKPEKLEERLIKNEDLEELKQTPHHVTLVNGPFHYVPIDRSEGSNDLILFNYLFMQFIQRTHEMYRIRVPDVDLGLLRGMVLQAFDGKRNISDIAGNHLPPLELRKVCNALASILHMQRNQVKLSV
nr:unnamed protein product [Haemonchus contortus]